MPGSGAMDGDVMNVSRVDLYRGYCFGGIHVVGQVFARAVVISPLVLLLFSVACY